MGQLKIIEEKNTQQMNVLLAFQGGFNHIVSEEGIYRTKTTINGIEPMGG